MSVLSTMNGKFGVRGFIVGAICAGAVLVLVESWLLIGRSVVLPNVVVAGVDIGARSRKEAMAELEKEFDRFERQGIALLVGSSQEQIPLFSIGAQWDAASTLERALDVGRTGGILSMLSEQISSLWRVRKVKPVWKMDEEMVSAVADDLQALYGVPRKDVRIIAEEGTLKIATDTMSGRRVNRVGLLEAILKMLGDWSRPPVALALSEDFPRADADNAPQALEQAKRMIADPLSLVYGSRRFILEPTLLQGWIRSDYDGERLVPKLDEQLLREYITTVASQINRPSRSLRLRMDGDRVVDFSSAQTGMALDEGVAISAIKDAITARASDTAPRREEVIKLSVATTQPVPADGLNSYGITELIGRATTPFTGSPLNRIHNIKNGVRFLSGQLVKAGEEFSTLAALGRIDNSTGYLPELVIKGDRTIPEFGGGLCQVSTTLFRAVMNAGLPITQRQNHSYRVPYYERDGEGRTIGPGLDATIYLPRPDFRFLNDTGSAILIYGYVQGDLVTFELYGTKDGRVARVDGPHTESTTSAGSPIYVQTDTLAEGVTKQIEKPHPGGSAHATYTVTYPDGRVNTQEFKSSYRSWPAQYLIGVAPKPLEEGGE